MQPLVSLNEGNDFGGDYVIERALSRGGMGAVYVALQKSTGRRRALKLMHPTLASDARAVERFTREAKVGALIHSDHVVEVIGAGVDEKSGVPWLSMELLEGEDLAARLSRGPMPASEAAEVLKQVAHALGAAHDVGVVHRDLKPENVFLVQTRRAGAEVLAKVLDFGIAKVLAEAGATSSGFIGTPAYMAPEQSAAGAVTAAADVWAYALMAFAMLTGKGFWKTLHSSEAGPIQLLNEVATAPVVTASARASDYGLSDKIPPGFDAWFARATARDAAQRIPNARAAWRELAPILGMVAEVAPLEDTAPSGKYPRQLPATSASLAQTQASAPAAPARPVSWRVIAGAVVAASIAGFQLVTSAKGGAGGEGKPAAVAVKAPPAPIAVKAPPAPIQAPQHEDDERFNLPVEGSPEWGPADALVTIVEFADFECPTSKSVVEVLEKARQEHPNDLRLFWKNYPLSIHRHSVEAARVANVTHETAGLPTFWKVHRALFNAQGTFSRPTYLKIAGMNGADPAKVGPALDRQELPARLLTDVREAEGLVLEGTPTLYLNGKRYGPQADHAKAIARELELARALVAKGLPRSQVYNELTRRGSSQEPRAIKVLPPLPANVFSRGSTEANAVRVVQFCLFTNWQCYGAEPSMRAVIDRHLAEVSFSWVSMVRPEYPESRLTARAAQSVRKAEEFWKLHDRILDAQQMPHGEAPPSDMFTAQSLHDMAIDAGVEPETYGYGQRGPADSDLEHQVSYAAQLGITDPTLFIDGERYIGWEPEQEIEDAIVRAIERRKSKR